MYYGRLGVILPIKNCILRCVDIIKKYYDSHVDLKVLLMLLFNSSSGSGEESQTSKSSSSAP